MRRLNLPGVITVIFLSCSVAYFVPPLFWNSLYSPHSKAVSVTPLVASTTPQSLAYYANAERLDPIFAIEGTDPAKLAGAVAAFIAERDQLVGTYGTKGSSIEASVYPEEFLTDLPTLEEARQALLAAPTAANASAYHYLLQRTIDDYVFDARTLANTLANAGSHIPTLGYVSGEASTADLASKMNLVADAALQQKHKESLRFGCLEQLSASCVPLSTLASGRAALLRTPAALPLPSENVYKTDAVTAHALPLFTDFSAVTKNIFAIPSDCYPEPVAYEREYYLAPYEGGVARKLDYINDAYFYDIPAVLRINPTSGLYQAMQKAGVTVQYQSIGNLYECPDSGLDVAQAGSLLGVINIVKQKEAPTSAEQKLLALPVVQKADIAPYVQAADKLHTPEGDDVVERYTEGSADFDQVVLGAHHDNRFLFTPNHSQKVSFDFLLTARNFASTLYLLGNPTFVPERVSFFSKNTESPLGKLALRSYLGDISKHYTDEELFTQIDTSIATEGIQLGMRSK